MSRAEAKITERDNMTVVHDTSVPVPIKLQAQLNDIVRLHTAIPMDLQKILYDFCNSRQFLSDYVFLTDYFAEYVAKYQNTLELNDTRWFVRLIAVKNLSADFDPKKKTDVFNALIEKLNDPNFNVKKAVAKALGDVFAASDSEQKTAFLKQLVPDGELPIENTVIKALGTVFAHLDNPEQKTLVLNKLIEKLDIPGQVFKLDILKVLGVVFADIDQPTEKTYVLNTLIKNIALDYQESVSRQIVLKALNIALVNADQREKTIFLETQIELLDSIDPPLNKLFTGPLLDKKETAITVLGIVFAHLDSVQKINASNKLIENLNDKRSCIYRSAAKTLGAAFVDLDSTQRTLVLDTLIKKSNNDNDHIKQTAVTALGAIFAYLDPKQKKLVLNVLIEQLNAIESCYVGHFAAITLGAVFVYLDNSEQKTLVFNELIGKLSNFDGDIKQTAEKAVKNIILQNALSPTQKQLLLPYPELTNTAEIKIAQAVLSFTSPCIYISATNRPKLTDALLAVNNIFYQDFLNPTETDLKLLKDKMTSLIRVTQESQSSVGLFSGVPADQQLMEYFKLPESLKARILLKEAFGFPDESVVEFEKSLRALMLNVFTLGNACVCPY